MKQKVKLTQDVLLALDGFTTRTHEAGSEVEVHPSIAENLIKAKKAKAVQDGEKPASTPSGDKGAKK